MIFQLSANIADNQLKWTEQCLLIVIVKTARNLLKRHLKKKARFIMIAKILIKIKKSKDILKIFRSQKSLNKKKSKLKK